jgi:predicted phosphodiesterase
MKTMKINKTKLAEEVVLENPSITANRTLAKILLNKYPLLFDDLEKARSAIRTATGTCGPVRNANRKNLLSPFLEKLNKARSEVDLDLRQQEDKTPYVFSEHYNKALVVGDFHYPYTDIDSLTLALEYGYNQGIDCIIINGDSLDFNTISRFISKPDEMRVMEQIEGVKNLLKWIQNVMDVKIVFHVGNHDKRIEEYVIRQAPELYHNNRLDKLLMLEDMKIDYVQDYRFMRFGNLNIAHGHYIVKGIFAPVSPARGVFTKTNTSTLISHVHRTSEHMESDMNGNVIGCFSIGAMTTITPDYNPQVSKHNQGFAIVIKDPITGEFEVNNKKIINHKIR